MRSLPTPLPAETLASTEVRTGDSGRRQAEHGGPVDEGAVAGGRASTLSHPLTFGETP
jgi:hypothetical protein